MNKELGLMLENVQAKGYNIKAVEVKLEQLVFEERVKMSCFHCSRYNVNWKCPPYIPDIDVPKMISEYDNMAFVYVKYLKEELEEDFEYVRRESSIHLHRALLECEKWMYEHNNSLALSYIGGSCKLCKNGCAPDRCVNPYQARSPIEALGINVVTSAARCGVEIIFPPTEYLIRIGLLLW